MKGFFKNTGKATVYFLVYILAQVVAFFVGSVVCGTVVAYQAGVQGKTLAPAEAMQSATELLTQNLGLALIANAVIAISIYVIFFAIRKKNFFNETSIKKISAKTAILAVTTVIGTYCCMNYALNFIPEDSSLAQNFIESSSRLSGMPFWQSLLATSIIVPILEEVVFRGLKFSRLNRSMPTWLAIIITSAVFGLVHGQALWAVWAGLLGVIINIVRVKTGSLIPCIIIHIINNTTSSIISELNLDTEISLGANIAVVVIGAVFLVTSLYLIGKDKSDNEADVEVSTVTA